MPKYGVIGLTRYHGPVVVHRTITLRLSSLFPNLSISTEWLQTARCQVISYMTSERESHIRQDEFCICLQYSEHYYLSLSSAVYTLSLSVARQIVEFLNFLILQAALKNIPKSGCGGSRATSSAILARASYSRCLTSVTNYSVFSPAISTIINSAYVVNVIDYISRDDYYKKAS